MLGWTVADIFSLSSFQIFPSVARLCRYIQKILLHFETDDNDLHQKKTWKEIGLPQTFPTWKFDDSIWVGFFMGKLSIQYEDLVEDKSTTNEMQNLKQKLLFWFNSP